MTVDLTFRCQKLKRGRLVTPTLAGEGEIPREAKTHEGRLAFRFG
jgi:hypothetical protein